MGKTQPKPLAAWHGMVGEQHGRDMGTAQSVCELAFSDFFRNETMLGKTYVINVCEFVLLVSFFGN
jgi:hypothetical protein